MNCICTAEDIKQLGTILGIWAHPDDDTYSMGGIMAAAVENGQTLAIITATKGEAGVQDELRWPAEKLAEIRSREMAEALNILGVKNHHWLNYPDGECKNVDFADAVNKITELIKIYQPDSIMTFGPDGMTGHEDHKTVSLWASMACQKLNHQAKIYHAINTEEQYKNLIEADKQFNIFFNIDKPPVCSPGKCAVHFELTPELYDKKIAALRSMESQTEGILKVFGDTLRQSFGTEAFIEAK